MGASIDAPTPTTPTATAADNALPSLTLPALLVVGNTDGMGVFLRRTPKLDDKVKPWRDGTPMVVLGGQQEGDGQLWWHVRAPDGSEGFVPAQYLVTGQ